jgi:hypothetical protein
LSRALPAVVNFDIERERDLVPQKFEARFAYHMSDIASRPGEEIIDAEDVMSLCEQTLA